MLKYQSNKSCADIFIPDSESSFLNVYTVLNCIRRTETKIAKTILIKKYKIRRFTLYNIKICYGAIVIKTMQHW